MSPFRVALSFAIAGWAVYQGVTYPGMRTWWYALAAFSFAVGIIRLIRNRKAAAQSNAGSDTPS